MAESNVHAWKSIKCSLCKRFCYFGSVHSLHWLCLSMSHCRSMMYGFSGDRLIVQFSWLTAPLSPAVPCMNLLWSQHNCDIQNIYVTHIYSGEIYDSRALVTRKQKKKLVLPSRYSNKACISLNSQKFQVKIISAAPTECALEFQNNALLDALQCTLPYWHYDCYVHGLVQDVDSLIVDLAGRIDRCLEDRLKAYAEKVESQNAFTYHIPPIKDQEEKYFLPYIGKYLMWVTNIMLFQVL